MNPEKKRKDEQIAELKEINSKIQINIGQLKEFSLKLADVLKDDKIMEFNNLHAMLLAEQNKRNDYITNTGGRFTEWNLKNKRLEHKFHDKSEQITNLLRDIHSNNQETTTASVNKAQEFNKLNKIPSSIGQQIDKTELLPRSQNFSELSKPASVPSFQTVENKPVIPRAPAIPVDKPKPPLTQKNTFLEPETPLTQKNTFLEPETPRAIPVENKPKPPQINHTPFLEPETPRAIPVKARHLAVTKSQKKLSHMQVSTDVGNSNVAKCYHNIVRDSKKYEPYCENFMSLKKIKNDDEKHIEQLCAEKSKCQNLDSISQAISQEQREKIEGYLKKNYYLKKNIYKRIQYYLELFFDNNKVISAKINSLYEKSLERSVGDNAMNLVGLSNKLEKIDSDLNKFFLRNLIQINIPQEYIPDVAELFVFLLGMSYETTLLEKFQFNVQKLQKEVHASVEKLKKNVKKGVEGAVKLGADAVEFVKEEAKEQFEINTKMLVDAAKGVKDFGGEVAEGTINAIKKMGSDIAESRAAKLYPRSYFGKATKILGNAALSLHKLMTPNRYGGGKSISKKKKRFSKNKNKQSRKKYMI